MRYREISLGRIMALQTHYDFAILDSEKPIDEELRLVFKHSTRNFPEALARGSPKIIISKPYSPAPVREGKYIDS